MFDNETDYIAEYLMLELDNNPENFNHLFTYEGHRQMGGYVLDVLRGFLVIHYAITINDYYSSKKT